MRSRRLVFFFFGWGCVVLGSGAGFARRAEAQSGPVAPQTSVAGELGSLATRAALVFVGQVVSIERRGGVVEVILHVEQTIAGQPGASYTLREWAGLWPQGQFRYTVGQRALIFLHGASSAGLGSPVDGAEGVVPVVVQGANASELLDIRRLGSALLRPLGTPLPTEAEGAIQLSDAVALIETARLPKAAPLREPVRWRVPVRGPLPRLAPPISEQNSEPTHLQGPISMPTASAGAEQTEVPYAAR